MATPVKPLHLKPSSTGAMTPNTAIFPSFLKQVFLHDWWLIKADSDSHGKRLGIGGFTSKEGLGVRCFSSASIVKRHDAVTLKTSDGITIMVHGHLNRSHTLKNGFSQEVCDHFLIGFPYYWEEFAALSVSEEPVDFSASKGFSYSDAYKAPTPGDHGANTLSRNIFDAILSEASSAKKESSLPTQSMISVNHKKTKAEKKMGDDSNVEHVKLGGPSTRSRALPHSGPLTRSRARLLDN